MYLAGHDHDMQHLEFEGHPTSFVLSGGGGADLYTLKIDEAQRGPYASRGCMGSADWRLRRRCCGLQHLDETGRVIHGFTKVGCRRLELCGFSH